MWFVSSGEREAASRCARELVLRFGYGAIVPWVTRLEDGTLRAVAGPDMVVLRTPVHLTGQNFHTVGEFTVAAGETVPFVLAYAPSHGAAAAAARSEVRARGDGSFLDELDEEVPSVRALLGCRGAFADHAQGADLWADRRDRRGADHLAAGATGREQKLGLSFLLAARRDADAAGVDECRLLRRGAGVARVAVARGRRQSRAGADHVRDRRRAPPDRMGGSVAAGLRRARRRCASATPPTASSSSTCSAR